MNDLTKLGIVIRYEFLKHIRRKRLWIIMGLAVVVEAAVLILVPVLSDGYPSNVLAMAAMLTAGPQLAALGAVFFAGDAIAGEFESKTGFLLFTNPVKKITLWTGKYLASYLAVFLMVILSYVIVAVSLLAIYGEVPFGVLKSFGLCTLYIGAVLSVTFLFSSISKGAMGATVIALVFIWVISGIVETVLGFTGNPYWFLISAQGDSISMVYGGLELFLSGMGSMGGGNFSEMMSAFQSMSISQAAWGMVIYLVVGFTASIWIAGRRQLA